MDVVIPEIPASYDSYRSELQAFIAEHKPKLEWKPGVGLRTPELASDVDALKVWVRKLHDAGYIAVRHMPTTLDQFQKRILAEELAASGMMSSLGNALVSGAIATFGTPEQQAEFLPKIATGEHIWTQLFSEPDAGSDLTSLKMKGVLDGDCYVVTGQKVWSTWAQFADYGYLLVRTEASPGPAGISAFILDMKLPGVTIHPLREITGTTDFNEVFLDEVRIPVGNMIGGPGQGWKVANASLGTERSGVGVAGVDADLQRLVALAKTSKRNGKPAILDSAVRQDLARFATRAIIQNALTYTVTTRADTNTSTASDAPVTKIWFSELNLELAEYAMSLQGASGSLVEGDPLVVDGGHWQDSFLYARAWTIAGGSNEIMRNLIAERGLGLPREPRGV
jgi:alkylation response protein AidB-like acyl-CoA dehydrogenase